MQNLLRIAAVALFAALAPSAFAAPAKFILDQDFTGPGGSDLQPILLFLDNPDAELLGLTGVTGDDWANKGVAHALRFLEIAGHPEVPVYRGASYPLLNTPERMARWEAAYGPISWKGAWNDAEKNGPTATFDPLAVPDLPEGNPTTAPQAQSAVDFLVEQVNKHPGEITIVAGGPLTNIALAVRQDPTFAANVKSVVISNGPQADFDPASGKPTSTDAFNTVFDPEAAQIVLTAGFPSIVVTGHINTTVNVDQALIDDIAKVGTPLSDYLATNAWKDLPLWDEIIAAVAIDPTLITRSATVDAAIDLSFGRSLGQMLAYGPDTNPGIGTGPVAIALDFDKARFRDMFLAAVARLK
ncbi:nucleoside hydrolase [Devosia sp. CN2-171]|uniref:nucleoside hydrolase n=1 Tax=Devosia sp. CN2-171 TaxID=3400909 RepID=UPI003BF82EF6